MLLGQHVSPKITQGFCAIASRCSDIAVQGLSAIQSLVGAKVFVPLPCSLCKAIRITAKGLEVKIYLAPLHQSLIPSPQSLELSVFFYREGTKLYATGNIAGARC